MFVNVLICILKFLISFALSFKSASISQNNSFCDEGASIQDKFESTL